MGEKMRKKKKFDGMRKKWNKTGYMWLKVKIENIELIFHSMERNGEKINKMIQEKEYTLNFVPDVVPYAILYSF